MVGTNPTPRARDRRGRERAPDFGDGADDSSSAVASASARYIGSRSGSRGGCAARCASTVAVSPRAIGPVRSKSLSMVRRISGTSASGGAPAASSARVRGAVQRDQEVRRDRRAGVVERAPVVGEIEGAQPERLGEPARRDVACVVGFAGHGGPRAVDLLGASGARERLQRMHAEAARVRLERRKRRRAADVRHPRTGVRLAATPRSRRPARREG